jgi:hypothetical protein
MGFDLGHFLSDAANTAGKVVSDVGKAVVKVGGDIVKGVGNILVAPFTVIDDLIHGKRIDQALLNSFHKALSGIQEIAPYAQTVIALVPGIGPVVSGAIGAALAIAEGKPIDEILVSAVAGAIPGGPFVKTAYDMGKAALEHKPLMQAIEQGVGDLASSLGAVIPDSAKDLLQSGLDAATKTAAGVGVDLQAVATVVDAIPDPIKKAAVHAAVSEATNPNSKKGVADVLVDAAKDMLPVSPEVKAQLSHALNIGMAMGHATHLQALQKQHVTSPAIVAQMNQKAATLTQDPVIGAARQTLQGSGVHGFDQGTGFMHTKGVTPYMLHAARSRLSPHDIRGFDTALALHIGRVKGPKAPAHLSYPARAAHAIVHGLKKAPVSTKMAVTQALQQVPDTHEGLRAAAAQSTSILHNKPFLLTAGGFLVGLAAGPVGAAIGAGIGYMLSEGGIFGP